MYDVLTKLRQLESSPIGKTLVVITKFRNNLDGIVDVYAQGFKGPVVSVEKSGDGWKAFAFDSTWLGCDTIEQISIWTSQKLSEILAAQQIS